MQYSKCYQIFTHENGSVLFRICSKNEFEFHNKPIQSNIRAQLNCICVCVCVFTDSIDNVKRIMKKEEQQHEA